MTFVHRENIPQVHTEVSWGAGNLHVQTTDSSDNLSQKNLGESSVRLDSSKKVNGRLPVTT
jgi:hypothetical protein